MELRIYTDAQGAAPFEKWLRDLKDSVARAKIRGRL
jgi:putative component of toxin-antitoxin plasmid stabilization module